MCVAAVVGSATERLAVATSGRPAPTTAVYWFVCTHSFNCIFFYISYKNMTNWHKHFTECNEVNSDYFNVNITEFVNKYSLATVTHVELEKHMQF